MLAGNSGFDPSATWLIQRISPTTSPASITFSSIPAGYSSLQIRAISKDTYTTIAGTYEYSLQFNGDTATNYSWHWLYGNGTSALATGTASTSNIDIIGSGLSSNAALANMYGVSIVDIIDYASTSKYKTVRAFAGDNANSTSTNYNIDLVSGLWRSTAAVTSITLIAGGTAFATGSTYALYGMK
jgi:hypothetical protein